MSVPATTVQAKGLLYPKRAASQQNVTVQVTAVDTALAPLQLPLLFPDMTYYGLPTEPVQGTM